VVELGFEYFYFGRAQQREPNFFVAASAIWPSIPEAAQERQEPEHILALQLERNRADAAADTGAGARHRPACAALNGFGNVHQGDPRQLAGRAQRNLREL